MKLMTELFVPETWGWPQYLYFVTIIYGIIMLAPKHGTITYEESKSRLEIIIAIAIPVIILWFGGFWDNWSTPQSLIMLYLLYINIGEGTKSGLKKQNFFITFGIEILFALTLAFGGFFN